jgi:hypothetical protein
LNGARRSRLQVAERASVSARSPSASAPRRCAAPPVPPRAWARRR